MNDSTTGHANLEEEEELRRLLESAGPRPEVPPEDLARIQRAFRAEWREHVRRRRARRFPARPPGRLLAIAAALVAALGLGWWLWSPGAPAGASPVARVESLGGTVTARMPGEGEGTPATRLRVGEEILPGVEVETAGGEAAGHAALRLADGRSLRLDNGSRVRLASASVLRLERGAVYLDSGGARPGAVEVLTPLGVVREVGTQFEVRLLEPDAALRVRVREGEVRVERGEASYPAVAGAELTLHAGGAVTRGRVPGHGSPWEWVVEAAPPLAIEGLPLTEVLDRIARETGWKIRYADDELASSARSIVVHGDLGPLTPAQALDVVLPGAGLTHRVEDGVLVIRAAGGS